MTSHFPIVFERETNGTVSAYVVGVPGVFAAADSEPVAARAIRSALEAHFAELDRLKRGRPLLAMTLRVARITTRAGGSAKVDLVGLGALLGRRRSARKAAAARANGKKGGRPRIER